MMQEGLNCSCTDEIKAKVERILLEVNKPSRYVGAEIGSVNRDWDKAELRTAVMFPDLYEIGISNLGHRIIYNLLNTYSEDSLADRVYAPDRDFLAKLMENNIPLYGVETFRPINEFDIIAVSLQYELSYPTILAVLDLGHVPIKSADRGDNDPIVIAGGPGSYNPETLVDFIDVIIAGDGEDVLIELANTIKNAKQEKRSREEILIKLSQIEGAYVPKFYVIKEGSQKPYPVSEQFNSQIKKRISDLNDKYPVNFPVPYSSSVHDRAVIEIRRGCARMCRFCQSCFVNLPVRERSAEDVMKITEELLKNTGYEEYSLLSLSSSDYSNILNLVCALNKKHSPTGASISLPSQRADRFSVELANEVQSVRKSTLTFAPEAGSQRLRDVINKNLSEEEILSAVISAYKAGWTSVKLYFMVGLPHETYDDLDEMVNLFIRIKDRVKDVKSELNLSKHLDIIATVSIFVPKPFTPFQWHGQNSIELIDEKIKYLRGKIKPLRGVKLNFHDSFPSQLEAVFARGDRNLNKLIELAYKKGSYLDAWSEHFNKRIWYEAAGELGINFNDYSTRELSLDDELPWDIIDSGVDKEWLKQEYMNAAGAKTTPPCDTSCASCGVCKNTGKSKVLVPVADLKNENVNNIKSQQPEIYRYRLTMQKTGNLRYISHLDWQKMVYMAVRKAGIKVDFTKGFNPSPKISVSLALPLFVESNGELVDMELLDQINEIDLLETLNSYLPDNSRVLTIVKIDKNVPSPDKTVCWAKYSARPIDSSTINGIDLNSRIKNILSQDSILIEKQKHKGLKKTIDIRPLIYSINLEEKNNFIKLEFILKTGQGGCHINGAAMIEKDKKIGQKGCHINGAMMIEEDEKTGQEATCINGAAMTETHKGLTLRADDFLNYLTPEIKWSTTREKLFDGFLKELV